MSNMHAKLQILPIFAIKQTKKLKKREKEDIS
jgi:hypothetical protein